jgi:hypothetical protein
MANILSESDLQTLIDYLSGHRLPSPTSVTINYEVSKAVKINTKNFSHFKTQKDISLGMSVQGEYLNFCMGTVSGQESYFGLLDLSKQKWACRLYISWYEVIAAIFDRDMGVVYLAGWAYRHVKPPLALVQRLDLANQEKEEMLSEFSREKNEDKSFQDGHLELDPETGILTFVWWDYIYQFET